jgi:hypothetical protein
MTTEMVLEMMNRTIRNAVTFKQYADGWYAVTFPYDPLVVSLIKCIPPSSRSYVPATRTWKVAFRYAQPLIGTLYRQGFCVEVIDAT